MNFKIIALSETAINSHHPYYNIPGYSIEQNFRPKRKGGGVALYIVSNLQYNVRNYLNLGDNTNSIFVETDRNQLKSKYNTVIGCIYRPPSYSLKSFNDSLTHMLSILQKKRKHILIAGDFNVNGDTLIRGDSNTHNFKNIFSANFLFPLISRHTRVTNHSATIIDNIYCNASDIATTCRSGILRFSILEHYAVFYISKTIKMTVDNQLSPKEISSRKIFLDSLNVLEVNHGIL